MKTIAEISVERHLDRSTLLKAAQRGTFGEAARQSGSTWLVDDASDAFLAWLAGVGLGRPRTIIVETPDAPTWVTSRAALYAWKNDHNWRGQAANADKDEVGAQPYREFLLHEALRMYGDK
jgi:hypothetical protein